MGVTYELDVFVDGKKYPSLEAGFSPLSRRLKDSDKLIKTIYKRRLRNFLNKIATDLERIHGTPYSGASSEDRLHSRTGEGVASIRKSITVTGSSTANIIGSIGGLSRLGIHEFGGTVTPKRSKFLTIPLPAALDSRGVPLRQTARQWDKTFIIKSKKGRLLIVRERGASIEPLYLLAKSATIRPRLGMRNMVQARLAKFADDLADDIVTQIFGEKVDA